MVLYGLLTQESIGSVLVAGILPGVMTAGLLMITAHVVARRHPTWAPRLERSQEVATPRSIWVVPAVFGLSIGGLYLGVFTPTEAAAIGAFLAIVFSVLSGRLDIRGFGDAVLRTVRLSAALFLILIGGTMFGFFLTLTRIPAGLTRFVADLPVAAPLIIASIFAIYFVMGALMEEIAILVIMTPIVHPVVIGLGYDGVWFGVMSIMMLLTGLLTPPVGLLSFVTSSATGVKLRDVYEGVTPFWLTLIVANALLIAFPDIALVLTRI
jgi:tripartite ATP-independent transporter DctM subunit